MKAVVMEMLPEAPS